ncbi:MAG: glycosyl hydrolase family 18 protein [Prevotella sp.]|jgi:chitinase|nr:glycosyl hydrolase family 18 protein [Prevotella sp.]MCI1686122.1 glycosyl hydrolase family 18 protein [Prevotella sp.]MCI1781585.1 glycosyl hydrolase family 18 protein [Prevotella sp.]MCI1802141.1 glycosyl hydrolase family 18 protein [Prevotella sp.]MCI1816834.1 glycosyl hydrolase family 18 protein [Prevotella sp.]
MKRLNLLQIFVYLFLIVCLPIRALQKQKLVVAYVSSGANFRLPDPMLMTNIDYAFGHVNKNFDGCDIQNEPFLRKVVALKEKNPELKIQLSIGGWTSGNFSEMAASPKNRMSFAKDCGHILKEYGLDGIDIDWEYPTSSESGISSSPEDTRNFTLLMRDLRRILGPKKLLTAAGIAYAKYIDFHSCITYINFVNIMAYDVADPPEHHTTLFRSPLSGKITVSEAVQAYISAGVPKSKLCLGMPFYGRGDHSNTILDKFMKTGYTGGLYEERWDSIGEVPYLVDWSGQLVLGVENPRSIAAKCQYILDQNLLGGMYWETTEDNAQLDLMNTVYLSLMKNKKASIPLKHVLLMTDGDGNNDIQYITSLGKEFGFDIMEYHAKDVYVKGSFDHYHLLYNINLNPETLSDVAKADFQDYIDEAKGSYIAINADTTKTWKWYNDFYRHSEKKHARSVIYKRNAGLGYMPRLSSYDQTKEKAIKWLLHE